MATSGQNLFPLDSMPCRMFESLQSNTKLAMAKFKTYFFRCSCLSYGIHFYNIAHVIMQWRLKQWPAQQKFLGTLCSLRYNAQADTQGKNKN